MEDSGKMPHKSFSAETTSKSSLPSQCVEIFSVGEFFYVFLLLNFCKICFNIVILLKINIFFVKLMIGILYKKVFYSIMPSEAFPSRRQLELSLSKRNLRGHSNIAKMSRLFAHQKICSSKYEYFKLTILSKIYSSS